MNVMFVLRSKRAFSDAPKRVASKNTRSLRSRIQNLLSSARVFSAYSLFNPHNFASISVYSTAKLFGCFHFCIVSLQSNVNDVVSNFASISVYSTAKLFGCIHFCIVSLQSNLNDVVSAIVPST